MRVSLVDGVHSGFNHVAWRIKIRFTDFQVNNASALRLKRAGFGQGFKCGFRSQAGHTFGQPQFCWRSNWGHFYLFLVKFRLFVDRLFLALRSQHVRHCIRHATLRFLEVSYL